MEDTIGVGIFLSHTTFPVAIGKGPPSHPASAKERPTSYLRRYHPTNLTLPPYLCAEDGHWSGAYSCLLLTGSVAWR